MLKQSCENPNRFYFRWFRKRYIFEKTGFVYLIRITKRRYIRTNFKYVGWYRP